MLDEKIYCIFIYTLYGDTTIYHDLYRNLVDLYVDYEVIFIEYEQYNSIDATAAHIAHKILQCNNKYILIGHEYAGKLAQVVHGLCNSIHTFVIDDNNKIIVDNKDVIAYHNFMLQKNYSFPRPTNITYIQSYDTDNVNSIIIPISDYKQIMTKEKSVILAQIIHQKMINYKLF